jgi:hypothetical protein
MPLLFEIRLDELKTIQSTHFLRLAGPMLTCFLTRVVSGVLMRLGRFGA